MGPVTRCATHAGCCALVILLVCACPNRFARADLLEEETQAQLEQWSENPLELRTVTPEELAQLPWLDWDEARAIAGLRELGALRQWEDLRQIPGLDAERIDAIRPFLRFESQPDGSDPPLRVWVRSDVGGQSDRAPRLRERIEVSSATWSLRAQRGEDRGWVGGRLTLGSTVLTGGRIRLDPGTPLLLRDPLTRSRLGAVPARTAPRLRLRGDTQSLGGFEGIALQGQRDRWLLAWGEDSDGQTQAIVAWQGAGSEHRAGAALDLRAGRTEGAAWWGSSDRPAAAAEIAGSPGRWKGSARVGTRGQGWRLQGALTSSLGASARGRDPITGQALDRPHRSAQLLLRHRAGAASLTWLARVVIRGSPGDVDISRRLRCEGRWRPGALRATWTTELLEGGPSGLGEARARVSVEEAQSSGRRRLGLAWRGDATAAATLAWAQWDRGRLRFSAAAAGGEGSSPWAVAHPDGALRIAWLRPGDLVLAAGARWRPGPYRIGIWAGVQTREGGAATPWIGARWEARWGGRAGAKVAPLIPATPEVSGAGGVGSRALPRSSMP